MGAHALILKMSIIKESFLNDLKNYFDWHQVIGEEALANSIAVIT